MRSCLVSDQALPTRLSTSTAPISCGAEDMLYGAKEIATFIRRTERQTVWLLESGRLPAFKVGSGWRMRPSAYDTFIEKLEQDAMAQALERANKRKSQQRA